MWHEEIVPDEWPKGIITIVPKKGDTSVCSNNRGITLRATSSKLFQVIMLNRVSSCIEQLLRENQCGFRRNRSTVDQLFSLQMIIRKFVDYNLPMKINFIDFRAAFDCIDRNYIWTAFEHYGMPVKYIRIFKAFYHNTMSAVRVNGELTDWFSVSSGPGQGEIQAPTIFGVVINWGLEMARNSKSVSNGLVLQKRLSSRTPQFAITDFDYADDLSVLDDTEEGLQETTDLITHHCGKAGLTVNAKKTKVMSTSKYHLQRPYPEDHTLNITANGIECAQESYFTYLGTVISSDGSIDREISTRIGKASGAMNLLNNVWRNRSITTSTKIRLYTATVITVLTYGCAAWTTTADDMHRLEVFHQRCIRRILRIRWFDLISNSETLSRANTGTIKTIISEKRLRWYGHVTRMPPERYPAYILDWTPKHGHRSQGAPRRTWTQCIEEDLELLTGKVGITCEQGKSLAKDRKLWRQMLKGCCRGCAAR